MEAKENLVNGAQTLENIFRLCYNKRKQINEDCYE